MKIQKHVKAFTYAPKIPAVLAGKCRQTIRPYFSKEEAPRFKPVHSGDEILFHNWTDRPYHSKWGWRLRVKVPEVEYAELLWAGIVRFQGHEVAPPKEHRNVGYAVAWGSSEVRLIAMRDGFRSEGEMKDYFDENIGLDDVPVPVQIMRWMWPPIKYEESE